MKHVKLFEEFDNEELLVKDLENLGWELASLAPNTDPRFTKGELQLVTNEPDMKYEVQDIKGKHTDKDVDAETKSVLHKHKLERFK